MTVKGNKNTYFWKWVHIPTEIREELVLHMTEDEYQDHVENCRRRWNR